MIGIYGTKQGENKRYLLSITLDIPTMVDNAVEHYRRDGWNEVHFMRLTGAVIEFTQPVESRSIVLK